MAHNGKAHRDPFIWTTTKRNSCQTCPGLAPAFCIERSVVETHIGTPHRGRLIRTNSAGIRMLDGAGNIGADGAYLR